MLRTVHGWVLNKPKHTNQCPWTAKICRIRDPHLKFEYTHTDHKLVFGIQSCKMTEASCIHKTLQSLEKKIMKLWNCIFSKSIISFNAISQKRAMTLFSNENQCFLTIWFSLFIILIKTLIFYFFMTVLHQFKKSFVKQIKFAIAKICNLPSQQSLLHIYCLRPEKSINLAQRWLMSICNLQNTEYYGNNAIKPGRLYHWKTSVTREPTAQLS